MLLSLHKYFDRRFRSGSRNRSAWAAFSAAFAAALVVPLPTSRLRPPVEYLSFARTARSITLVDRYGSGTLSPLNRSTSPLNYMLFAGLTAFDRRGHLVPELLARLPSLANGGISPNGKLLTLDLRPHQYWSSGAEITSADVVFGWQVATDSASGDLCRQAYACNYVSSVGATGRYRVLLRLKSPFAPFLTCCLPPVLPHSWPRLGHDPHTAALRLARGELTYRDSSYWTDGPFQIRQFQPGGRTVVLAPMKYYRLHPGPHIEHLTFYAAFSTAATFAAAAARGATVTADGSGALLPALWLHRSTYSLTLTPSLSVQTMQFNALDATVNGKPNPLHDTRVREALSLAIDRDGFAANALGISRKAAHILAAYSPFLATNAASEMYATARFPGAWDPLRHGFIPYGPQAIRDARALLRSAGYTRALDVQLLAAGDPQGHIPGISVIRQNWQAIGVRLQANRYYTILPCYDAGVHGGYFQIYMGQVMSGPDPSILRYSLDSDFVSRPPHNSSAPCNDNVSGVKDRLIDSGFRDGATTFDIARRIASYNRVAREVSVHAYWAPLYYVPNVFTHDRRITGVTGYPLPSLLTHQFEGYAHNAYQWQYVR